MSSCVISFLYHAIFSDVETTSHSSIFNHAKASASNAINHIGHANAVKTVVIAGASIETANVSQASHHATANIVVASSGFFAIQSAILFTIGTTFSSKLWITGIIAVQIVSPTSQSVLFNCTIRH